MKRIINITAWILFFGGILVLVGFIDAEHKKITCKDMDVLIDYRNGDPLIYEDDIKSYVIKHFDTLVGRKLTQINFSEVENQLKFLPEVEKADVYSTIRGKLKIKIKQRTPVLRIINQKNKNYYVDKFGKLFKCKVGSSSRVIVANGYISEHVSDTTIINAKDYHSMLNKLLLLGNYIQKDEFLKAQIEQIYVTKNGEFELTPKVGRQLIIFGGINDMENKFDKLIVFYKEGMNKKGWNQYKTINLKFENQVVCSKN